MSNLYLLFPFSPPSTISRPEQVVMYHMFESYNDIGTSQIQVIDIVSGVASFFVVALGGTIIGK